MPARAQTPLPHELFLDVPLFSSLLSSARRLVVELVRAGDNMAAAKQQPPLYIVVADDRQRSTFPCTRPILQSALQLMGCKPRHTFKERSRKNADNRKKQKTKHKIGSKSYSQVSFEKV
ncbi:uncharacterized protein LOC125553580 [Triticum urartu]|uniref:uncharacterized protein LOC125553580 n=1 Tax=Triticum urartu TaxID=4572 RepID=UPI0020437326|nr:uncharacterized protein LOC125553580 [Triticum urartu]